MHALQADYASSLPLRVQRFNPAAGEIAAITYAKRTDAVISDSTDVQGRENQPFVIEHVFLGDLRKMIGQAIFRCQQIMYWCEADQAFIGEVPALAGRMAEGESHEDALANDKFFVKTGIVTALATGSSIP